MSLLLLSGAGVVYVPWFSSFCLIWVASQVSAEALFSYYCILDSYGSMCLALTTWCLMLGVVSLEFNSGYPAPSAVGLFCSVCLDLELYSWYIRVCDTCFIFSARVTFVLYSDSLLLFYSVFLRFSCQYLIF